MSKVGQAAPLAIERAVILGHSGFIGKHLVEHMAESAPRVEVIGRSFPPFDLGNKADVAELAGYCGPETAIVMLSGLKRQFGDDPQVFLKNVNMAVNLGELLIANPVAKVVFFSSAAVYGEDIHNVEIDEESAVCPTSYYGIAKYTSECLLSKALEGLESTSLTVLRPPVIYGPGDAGKTYGPAGFVAAAAHGESITLWGDGSELREFIFIDDLVKIVRRLMFHPDNGVFNVAGGQSHSFKEILDIVLSLASRQVRVDARPRTKRRVDNAFNNDRLLAALPGVSFTGIKAGIERTWEAELKLLELESAEV